MQPMKAIVAGMAMAVFAGAANAATITPTGTNKFSVIFDGTNGDPDTANLGTLNLDLDDIAVTGIVTEEAPDGVLEFLVTGTRDAIGALQLIIQFAGNTLTVDTAEFDGSPIALASAPGGLAGSFSGTLTDGNAVFKLEYSNASGGETINLGLAAVPVPAAGLMLILGLGGLAAVRRRMVV